MRQVPGAPTTLFKETRVLWCVRRSKRSKGINSLASTHILHHTLPAFILLQSHLGSVRKSKNAFSFGKKKQRVPLVSCLLRVGSHLPAQCSAWLEVPLGALFHPPPPVSSVWSCWGRHFWSPTPSHSLMWALQDAEFVGEPFPASPPGAAGGSQDRAMLCQLSLWLVNLEMTDEQLGISNMAPPGHSPGGMEAELLTLAIEFALNLLGPLQAKGVCFWAGRSECDSKGETREEGEWRALHRGDTLEGRAGKLRPWSICTSLAICGWMQTTVRQ